MGAGVRDIVLGDVAAVLRRIFRRSDYIRQDQVTMVLRSCSGTMEPNTLSEKF